jgi:hypothetical protein
MPHLVNLSQLIAIKDAESILVTNTLIAEIGHVYPISGKEWKVTEVIIDGRRIPLSNPVTVVLRNGAEVSSQHFSDDRRNHQTGQDETP